MKFWILAAFLPGVFALTDTVWTAKSEENGLEEAFVKSISEDGVVSLALKDEEDSLHRQTVELCSQWHDGEVLDASEGERMERLRKAFREGKPVRVRLLGNFTHCVSQVSSL